jgi:hypothetical protein
MDEDHHERLHLCVISDISNRSHLDRVRRLRPARLVVPASDIKVVNYSTSKGRTDAEKLDFSGQRRAGHAPNAGSLIIAERMRPNARSWSVAGR